MGKLKNSKETPENIPAVQDKKIADAGADDLSSHFSLFSNKMLITVFLIVEIVIILLLYPDYKVQRAHMLAKQYAANNEYAKSKQQYMILKGIYPLSLSINLECGYVLYSLKEYNEALNCFTIVMDNTKGDIAGDLYKMIGMCHINLNNKQQALLFFEKAIQKLPNDQDANFYLGEELLRQKKYAEAAKFFQRIPNPQAFGKSLENYWVEIEKAILGDLADNKS